MSDSEIEAGSNVQRDALGIVVFALATFASISVGMSIWRPTEVPSSAMARAVSAGVDAIGVAPLLGFTLGLALLGAGTWLFSRSASLRDFAGLFGCVLGLSILLGAVSADAGGLLGALSGGKVSGFLSYLVAVPFGLACLLLPAWLAWGRSQGGNSWNLGQDSPAPAAPPASEVEGVSPAEAEALLPRVPPRLAPTPPPPSPYPPDVRLQGRIPEGARPIYFDDDSRAEALPDPDLEAALLGQPSEGLEASPGPARAHLARPDAHHGALRGPLGFPEDPGPGRPAGEGADEPLALGAAPSPARESGEADPPRPTWEQPNLFGEEAVDAYGTPLSILRTHRGDAVRSPVVDPPDLPSDTGEVALAERALADLDAEDEGEDQAGLPLAVIEEDEGAAGAEDEDEEYEEDEDSEVEVEEDELALEDDSGEPEEAELELELSEAADEDEDEDETEDGETEDEEEGASVRPARGPLVAAWEAESEELEAEPQVELVPQPAGGPPLGGPSEDLVRRAAALFLERQRVAVSLLQREFDLDFEQSTAVLDRLQAQGLIGPYLGGQRREILMSAAEWEQRTAAR